MIPYDVELWQNGAYRQTLAGPFETRLQAAGMAETLAAKPAFDGTDIRVRRFEAVEVIDRRRSARATPSLFLVRLE